MAVEGERVTVPDHKKEHKDSHRLKITLATATALVTWPAVADGAGDLNEEGGDHVKVT